MADSEVVESSLNYEEVPDYVSGEPVWYQENRLYLAYAERSQEKLNGFLNAWSSSSKPRSEDDLIELPDAIRHTYLVFEDFYQPHRLERIGDPEWGVDQFKDASRFIVQTSLRVVVSDRVAETGELYEALDSARYVFELQEFRPLIQGPVKSLYLTKFYENLMSHFLGSDELPVGHDGVMSTSKAVGESEKRQEFLNTSLKIYHGHWGGWRLGTDPTVTTIQFNDDFTHAVVHFTLVYQGGEARYKRRGDKWVLIKSELTWIT